MMDPGRDLVVRVARPADAAAVGALLRAAYSALLAGAYDAALLERALPWMAEPNPKLLRCGTWYVTERAESPWRLVGCGGWTLARPGDGTGEPDPTVGHLRHFATHSDCARRGIGRAVFAHCLTDGLAAGVPVFECQSTLTAERFYRALGFELLRPITALLGGRLPFPGLRLRRRLAEAACPQPDAEPTPTTSCRDPG